MKKCLFGGALLAAGLGASASAQQFNIGAQPYGNYVGAFFGGFIPFGINGFYNQTAASGTAYAQAYGGASVISAYAYSGNTGLAYTIHFSPVPFTVTQNTVATLSWNFRGDTDGLGGYFIDSFVSVNGTVFGDLNNPVGSAQINLAANVQHNIFGTALATGGTSFYQLVVPAPASAGLLALAGLAASRRRR